MAAVLGFGCHLVDPGLMGVGGQQLDDVQAGLDLGHCIRVRDIVRLLDLAQVILHFFEGRLGVIPLLGDEGQVGLGVVDDDLGPAFEGSHDLVIGRSGRQSVQVTLDLALGEGWHGWTNL